MKTTMRTYWQRRVQRGAMYLDLTMPGWAEQINQRRLRLASTCDCIVGQLHGDFWNGVADLLPPGAAPRDFGMHSSALSFAGASNKIGRRFNGAIYRTLDALWHIEIEERLANRDKYAEKPETPRERRARLLLRDRLASGAAKGE